MCSLWVGRDCSLCVKHTCSSKSKIERHHFISFQLFKGGGVQRPSCGENKEEKVQWVQCTSKGTAM